MNKEKDFFKTCFNIVAGLDIKNESQAIAKAVVLSEIKNLQDENKALREIIKIIIEDQQISLDQARNYLIKKKKFKYDINEYNNPIIDYSSFFE